MMQIDNSKLERQKLGAERWKLARGIGAWNWVPRFGKTFGAINFIVNPHLKIKSDNKIIILVASDIVSQQWQDNLRSYGENLDRVTISTAHAATNSTTIQTCSLLIVDELHKFQTDERIKLLDKTKIKYQYILGLTGTYPFDNYTIRELCPVIDTITEQEAIDNKWISNFIEYNILLELTAKDKERYRNFSIPITETLNIFTNAYKLFTRSNGDYVFNDDFSLIMACYQGFKTINYQNHGIYIRYDVICNELGLKKGWTQNIDITTEEGKDVNDKWNPTKIHERAKNFVDYIRRRNDILINNDVKLYAILDILKHRLVSTICFNESTSFADRICNMVNAKFNPEYRAACYHSNIESRPIVDPVTNEYFIQSSGKNKGNPKIFGATAIRKMVIEYARLGIYRFVSTAKALDEGVDIPKIEQVICTGGSTDPLNYQQRTARGKTIDIYNPDKTTIIFNLVFDDFVDEQTNNKISSRDKQKLVLRQKNTGSFVKWITLDMLNDL